MRSSSWPGSNKEVDMKRALAIAVLAASAILALVVSANAGAGDHHGGRTITVVEHADTDAVTNGTAETTSGTS